MKSVTEIMEELGINLRTRYGVKNDPPSLWNVLDYMEGGRWQIDAPEDYMKLRKTYLKTIHAITRAAEFYWPFEEPKPGYEVLEESGFIVPHLLDLMQYAWLDLSHKDERQLYTHVTQGLNQRSLHLLTLMAAVHHLIVWEVHQDVLREAHKRLSAAHDEAYTHYAFMKHQVAQKPWRSFFDGDRQRRNEVKRTCEKYEQAMYEVRRKLHGMMRYEMLPILRYVYLPATFPDDLIAGKTVNEVPGSLLSMRNGILQISLDDSRLRSYTEQLPKDWRETVKTLVYTNYIDPDGYVLTGLDGVDLINKILGTPGFETGCSLWKQGVEAYFNLGDEE